MPPSATELRCHLHLHGILKGDVAEILCHQCSRATGTHVVHRWNVRTGEWLDAAEHDEIAAHKAARIARKATKSAA